MQFTIAPQASSKPPVFVVLKLGGGFDALYAYPPLHHEKRLRELRPTLNPESYRYNFDSIHSIDLDGEFGIHPEMHHIRRLFQSGNASLIYGIGSPRSTLSHFDSMKLLEQGGETLDEFQSGWLGRYMQERQKNDGSILAVSTTANAPLLLRGCNSLHLPHAKTPKVHVPPKWSNAFFSGLELTQTSSSGMATEGSRSSLKVMRILNSFANSSVPVKYIPTARAKELELVGKMILAEIGLEVAVIEFPGWDFHESQAGMSHRLFELSSCIDSFFQHIGKASENVVLITVSEFGRRVAENVAKGSDHGRATASLVVGDTISGGKVFGQFKGLDENHLDADGNIPVTTNYRDVFESLLSFGANPPKLRSIFRS